MKDPRSRGGVSARDRAWHDAGAWQWTGVSSDPLRVKVAGILRIEIALSYLANCHAVAPQSAMRCCAMPCLANP